MEGLLFCVSASDIIFPVVSAVLIHSKSHLNEKATKLIDLKRTLAITIYMNRVILWRLISFFGLLTLLLALSQLSYISFAASDTRVLGKSGHPLPRFVSLKSNEVNIRRGPGTEYPVLWQFRKRGLPVEIIAEYELWRQIRDHEGAQGWVHAGLLRGQRSVIVKHAPEALPLRASPDSNARMLALIQPGVVARLEECEQDWCEIDVDDYEGWVPRDLLWGIYPFEFFED